MTTNTESQITSGKAESIDTPDFVQMIRAIWLTASTSLAEERIAEVAEEIKLYALGQHIEGKRQAHEQAIETRDSLIAERNAMRADRDHFKAIAERQAAGLAKLERWYCDRAYGMTTAADGPFVRFVDARALLSPAQQEPAKKSDAEIFFAEAKQTNLTADDLADALKDRPEFADCRPAQATPEGGLDLAKAAKLVLDRYDDLRGDKTDAPEFAILRAALAVSQQAAEPFGWCIVKGDMPIFAQGAENPWKPSANAFPVYRAAPLQQAGVSTKYATGGMLPKQTFLVGESASGYPCPCGGTGTAFGKRCGCAKGGA